MHLHYYSQKLPPYFLHRLHMKKKYMDGESAKSSKNLSGFSLACCLSKEEYIVQIARLQFP